MDARFVTFDDDAPECESCGCTGNMSCGKPEPPHDDCCLDQTEICPCCNSQMKSQGKEILSHLTDIIKVQDLPQCGIKQDACEHNQAGNRCSAGNIQHCQLNDEKKEVQNG